MSVNTKSTVVALYKSTADAQAAASELKSRGFQSGDIYLSSGDAPVTRDTTTAASGYGSHHQHEGGITGWFKSLFSSEDNQERTSYEGAVRQGDVLLSVDTEEDRAAEAVDIMERYNPTDVREDDAGLRGTSTSRAVKGGSGEMPSPVAAAPSATYPVASQGPAKTAGADARSRVSGLKAEAEDRAIPVIQEELQVGKQQILRGGVRVYSRSTNQPVEETIRLREEHVRVNREPVNRPVSQADLGAGTDQVIEVEEFAEQPVVSKQARVVEEVRIHKDATERTETVRDNVRRTDVFVEDMSGSKTTAAATEQPNYDADYRRDFQTRYAASGADYAEYGPAYRYGYEIASDPRYRNRSFEDAEADLKADYGRRYPNGAWDRFKDSVRYGWDRVTGKTKAAVS